MTTAQEEPAPPDPDAARAHTVLQEIAGVIHDVNARLSGIHSRAMDAPEPFRTYLLALCASASVVAKALCAIGLQP